MSSFPPAQYVPFQATFPGAHPCLTCLTASWLVSAPWSDVWTYVIASVTLSWEKTFSVAGPSWPLE